MPKAKPEPLFIGVGGHVVAIDVATGEDLWRTKLKSNYITTVCPAGPRVFAGAGGELFCLDARTGEILWHNKLKGLGLGIVAFASSVDAAAAAALEAQRQQSSAAAAAAAT
jgi:outer membrane protein assembly factor BamB